MHLTDIEHGAPLVTPRARGGRTSPRPLRTWLVLATVVAALPAAPPARASDFLMYGVSEGVYVLPGFVGAAGIHQDLPVGGIAGGELSVVVLLKPDAKLWVGGFADAVWDTGPGETRVSVGPEVGIGPFGVDVAFTSAYLDDWSYGVSTRLFFSMAIVAMYARYGHLFGHPVEADYGEAGLLLKVPIPLSEL